MDTSKLVAEGLIELRQVDPATLTPGQLADNIKEHVLRNNVKIIAIDSLNGYLNAAPSEKFLNIHLHELLSFLRHQGVISILTVAQTGMLGPAQAPIDVSYLADTVVLLRFFETQGRVKKAISIIKKRTGAHEDSIREFRISSHGIEVGDPLVDFHGVLTGVPTYHGKAEKILGAERPKI